VHVTLSEPICFSPFEALKPSFPVNHNNYKHPHVIGQFSFHSRHRMVMSLASFVDDDALGDAPLHCAKSLQVQLSEKKE